jgi:hypothetical protein
VVQVQIHVVRPRDGASHSGSGCALVPLGSGFQVFRFSSFQVFRFIGVSDVGVSETDGDGAPCMLVNVDVCQACAEPTAGPSNPAGQAAKDRRCAADSTYNRVVRPPQDSKYKLTVTCALRGQHNPHAAKQQFAVVQSMSCLPSED